MKKTLFLFPVVFLFIFSSFRILYRPHETMKSAGPPPYSTEAPGELTCAQSTCHDGTGSTPNTGPGVLTIDFDGGKTQYVPGLTYTVTISLSQPSIQRFGFQVVSLRNSNNTNSGIITLLDTVKTQSRQPTYGSYQDRIYVEHKTEGTKPFSSGLGKWSYQWKAPVANVGAITFYAAALSANNDALDTMDQTYTKNLTITPGVASIDEPGAADPVQIYPNPASEKIAIRYSLSNEHNITIRLVDANGKNSSLLLKEKQPAGHHTRLLSLPGQLATGVYFLYMHAGENQITKKVYIYE